MPVKKSLSQPSAKKALCIGVPNPRGTVKHGSSWKGKIWRLRAPTCVDKMKSCKTSLLALGCVLGFTLVAQSGENPMPKNQQAHSFKQRQVTRYEGRYLVFLPKEYSKARKWPMILFLHGSGERGTNLDKVAVHGPPKIVQRKPDFLFIVISPQCPEGETWSEDALLALLGEVNKKFKVDQRRVYLTGLSMGGYGTWNLGLSHPEKFAAIAPICGGGDNLRILLAEKKVAKRLKQLPVWAFHGTKDEVVNVTESERMVRALRKLGNEARLTMYPEAGHDAWTETYNNPALYEWFLQQENPNVAADGKSRTIRRLSFNHSARRRQLWLRRP